jgi:hypothetical protein
MAGADAEVDIQPAEEEPVQEEEEAAEETDPLEQAIHWIGFTIAVQRTSLK